jgi:hypothetical protein
MGPKVTPLIVRSPGALLVRQAGARNICMMYAGYTTHIVHVREFCA